MKNLIPLLAALLFLISCGNDKEKEVEQNTIDLNALWNSEDYLKLSELAESIEYVALETNEKCVLDNASSLRGVKSGDRIFIYSRESNIRVFNGNGKYLFDLGSYGQGPEEYISIQLKADSSSKLVWILDSRQHKVLKYDYSGNFIESFKIHDDVVKFSLLDDSQIALLKMPYPGQEKKAISVQIASLSGEIVEDIFLDSLPAYQGGSQPRARSFLANIDGKLHVSVSPFRQILQLNEHNLWDTILTINHGENTAEDELYNGPYQTLLGSTHLSYVSELSGHILINGLYERTNRYFLYDKSNKTTRLNHLVAETTNRGDMIGFLNDIDGGLPFWPAGSAGENTYMRIYNAQRYIDMANGEIEYYYVEQDTNLSEDLKFLCESLTPDDNPVIMLVKFKKDS